MKDYFETKARYLILDVPVPYAEMLKEAQALKNRYTEHRSDNGGHKGWKSLALYGLGEDLHESWEDYGYATGGDAAKDFMWTPAARECPATMDFLLNTFPCKKYGRVRFMLLEAGGFIDYHSDNNAGIYLTENTNIPLNNPKECLWKWGDGHPDLFMEPGKPYAMNITYEHAVFNNSNEDRYHLIIARHDATDQWKTLISDAAKKENIEGRFITIDALP